MPYGPNVMKKDIMFHQAVLGLVKVLLIMVGILRVLDVNLPGGVMVVFLGLVVTRAVI